MNHRVLIVEDDAEMGSLLKDLIEEEGLEVESVADGLQAYQKMIQASFDLIITDLRMPGSTGLDILSVMQQRTPEIPVIVITAFGGETVRSKVMAKGAAAYLEKPILWRKLKTLVCDLLPVRRKEMEC
jgi:DNA-binding NtrC family response regulator